MKSGLNHCVTYKVTGKKFKEENTKEEQKEE